MSFSRKHVVAVAALVDFQIARKEMLKRTPIAENPTLFERTQNLEVDHSAAAVKHFDGIESQVDSVMFDNLVAEEVEDRRLHRRQVRQAKRLYLTAAAGI